MLEGKKGQQIMHRKFLLAKGGKNKTMHMCLLVITK
jgi:hypothetical protein